MSQRRPDLLVSKEEANKVVGFLASIEFVDEVYINGSRSPISRRQSRSDSDWDFLCVTNRTEKVRYYMRRLRDSHKFHGDAIFINRENLHRYLHAVMVHPTDEQKVIT